VALVHHQRSRYFPLPREGDYMTQRSFADYYEVLQISPNADQETIERMYRFLAKRYHPDNKTNGNDEKFKLLLEAYRTLCDPEKRVAYDVDQKVNKHIGTDLVDQDPEYGAFGTDKQIRQSILSLLYQAKRRDAQNSGIGAFEMEKLLTVPEKHLEFHIWYLKEKDWIRRADTGKYEITATGVDALIENDISINKNQFLLEASYSQSN
jgi:curved DNA-binding protein CbpA